VELPFAQVLVQLLLCFLSFEAVSLLQLTDQLISFPCDDVQIAVRELAPLLFDLALDLLPISFDLIPVHDLSLLSAA